jgi:hypothetical protein
MERGAPTRNVRSGGWVALVTSGDRSTPDACDHVRLTLVLPHIKLRFTCGFWHIMKIEFVIQHHM